MSEKTREAKREDLVRLRFLEAVAARLPDDDAVLAALGDLYTRVGFYQEGLAADFRLVELRPGEALVWYNLGCSLALVNRRGEAIEALKRAVSLGYDDLAWMARDEDLRSLRDEGAFRALIGAAEKTANSGEG